MWLHGRQASSPNLPVSRLPASSSPVRLNLSQECVEPRRAFGLNPHIITIAADLGRPSRMPLALTGKDLRVRGEWPSHCLFVQRCHINFLFVLA